MNDPLEITTVPEDFDHEREAYFAEHGFHHMGEIELARLHAEAEEWTVDVPAEAMAAVGLPAEAASVTYRIVDLRGKIAGNPVASQGTQSKTDGTVVHYNGPATGVASGRVSPVTLYDNDARYHMSKDWGGGSYTNGIQYHEGMWEDVVYILRNGDSILWHCGGWPWNASAKAINIPIGTGERATKRTLQTMAARITDINRAQGKDHRATYGHYEVGLPTACPDSLMGDFVVPFRAGKLNPGPAYVAPAKVSLINPGTSWAQTRVDALRAAFNSDGKLRVMGIIDPKKALSVSQQVYDSPAGTLRLIAVGASSMKMLSQDVQNDIGKYGQDFDFDILDGLTDAHLYADALDIERKDGPKGAAAAFAKEIGFTPGKAEARGIYDYVGLPRFTENELVGISKKMGLGPKLIECISHRYDVWNEALAKGANPSATPAPDAQHFQSIVETGKGIVEPFTGRWQRSPGVAGDAGPYNLCGLNKADGSNRGPQDFERPTTARRGVEEHYNHGSIYTGNPVTIGILHGRYAVAKQVRASKPTIRTVDGLTGSWATDPHYAEAIKSYMDQMEGLR